MSFNRPAHSRVGGFTLMETLVVIGIFIVLVSIFVPYLLSVREKNRRVWCADNLRQIRSALQNYARDNNWEFPRVRYDAQNNPNGYVAFSGPDADDPFAPDSPVQPNDVTASLWLLVRIGYVADTRAFVCPSSGDSRDWITSAHGQPVPPNRRGNFRRPSNLSYSYASPFSSAPGYRLKPDWLRAEFALLADKNPGSPAAQVPYNAPPAELARANSPNHGHAGQNVVYGDGSIFFQRTPYCGVGYDQPPGDNIYTARAQTPSTQPTTIPFRVTGFVGPGYAPVALDDSYLVPTVQDAPPPPVAQPPATTQPPATQPATQ
ncbi:type II secretion system protein [Fontivita pretiosa]|uniref:type II secretion system protein n=1 Tax=Fontivita pretiosa TaxID=2989684 RepID=UPI003D178109